MLRYRRRERFRRSSRQTPCPICGKGGCGQSDAKVLCFRVQEGSNKQAKSGAWIHTTIEAGLMPVARRIETPLASIERRDAVYSTLLQALNLNQAHGEHLANDRRLSERTILKAGFRSVPSRMLGDALAAQLAAKWELKGVPGFWKKDSRPCLRFAGANGFFIPIKNASGKIEALQIRRENPVWHWRNVENGKQAFVYGLSFRYWTDGGGWFWECADKTGESESEIDAKAACEKAINKAIADRRYLLVSSSELPDGVSSGAPHHFTGQPCATVIVTEGALKAEVIAEAKRRRNESDYVIGLVSVSTFEDSFGANLKRICPFVQTVQLAFDSDWRTNEKVQAQMKRFANSIRSAGLKLQVLAWESEEKGYDDLLLKGER